MKNDRLYWQRIVSNIENVVIKQHFLKIHSNTKENTMDSQEQYDALLKRWGLEDQSAERRARREKLVRHAKVAATYVKKMLAPTRKAVSRTPATH